MDLQAAPRNDIFVDPGLLLVTNYENEFSTCNLKDIDPDEIEIGLKHCASKCFNSLISNILTLNTDMIDGRITYKLPESNYKLPRAKPLPKQKPLTKWEKFRKERGIQTHKKSRFVYDEASEEFKPRFGKNRINSVADQWAVETPKNLPQGRDPFEMMENKKKENIAKNEHARLKNIESSQKKQPELVKITKKIVKKSTKKVFVRIYEAHVRHANFNEEKLHALDILKSMNI